METAAPGAPALMAHNGLGLVNLEVVSGGTAPYFPFVQNFAVHGGSARRRLAVVAVVSAAGAVFLGIPATAVAAPKQEWLPVTAEERGTAAPHLEPDAPAEVLFRKVEIDDRDFPEERVMREYVRYKVFQPEQIDSITRLAVHEYSDSSLLREKPEVKLQGRLTLPDGTVKVFGEEAIRDRAIAQSGGEKGLLERVFGSSFSAQVKERFLAISGVEAGAVLEYRVEVTEGLYTGSVGLDLELQTLRMPVRQIEYRIHPADPKNWSCRYHVLNKSVGQVTLEKESNGVIAINGSNLPSLPSEPRMAPTPAYYGLYFLFDYEPIRLTLYSRKRVLDGDSSMVDPRKTGPWSPLATREYLILDDRVEVTPRIRQLAAEATAGAGTPLEKARAIHRRVQALYARFRDESKLNKTDYRHGRWSRSLHDLLDYDRKSNVTGLGPRDFSALAIALYQAAGLECRGVLVPNWRLLPFSRQVVATATLPVLAVAVRLDGDWHYSLPATQPAVAFGSLPWSCEGAGGLWAQAGPEQFTAIPFADSASSLIGNSGVFSLNADGTLTGEAHRKYTGHSAETLRERLYGRDERRQRNFLARQLNEIFRSAGVETTAPAPEEAGEGEEPREASTEKPIAVTSVSGVDDPEAPIEIAYTVRLPGFAVATGGRMILRPWLFRLNEGTPFTATTRKVDVYFPYAWQELDTGVIKLPPDCTPEFSEAPVAQSGRALHYQAQVTYSAGKHQLQFRREFASNVISIPVAAYPNLMAWYAEMARGDQQEVVLNRAPAAVAGTPSPGSAAK